MRNVSQSQAATSLSLATAGAGADTPQEARGGLSAPTRLLRIGLTAARRAFAFDAFAGFKDGSLKM